MILSLSSWPRGKILFQIVFSVRVILNEQKWVTPAERRGIERIGAVLIATAAFSPKVIWGVVKQACGQCGLTDVAPHDLRRTCARLCHQAGAELEQIQFLLGHVSVQTTERYLWAANSD
jgi:site-specific recombinase XerD